MFDDWLIFFREDLQVLVQRVDDPATVHPCEEDAVLSDVPADNLSSPSCPPDKESDLNARLEAYQVQVQKRCIFGSCCMCKTSVRDNVGYRDDQHLKKLSYNYTALCHIQNSFITFFLIKISKIYQIYICFHSLLFMKIKFSYVTQKFESGLLCTDNFDYQSCSSLAVWKSASTLRLSWLQSQLLNKSRRRTRPIFSAITAFFYYF